MLPKVNRLNLKTDFKRVASGRSLETKHLKLFIKKETSGPKLGIALSSKNFKRAVDRNRARRLTSAAFEKIFKELSGDLSIIALPKRSVIDVKSEDILKELEKVLATINENSSS